MKLPVLNLVVIRSSDIDKAAAFYTALGLRLSKHAHGTGPLHYASENEGVTVEIYPQGEAGLTTVGTRLGFTVKELDALLPTLVERGGRIASPTKESPWGRRAVVIDPDGHKVELVQAFP